MSFSNRDFISTGPDKVPEIGLFESVKVRSTVTLLKRLLGVVPEIALLASSRIWSSVAWDKSGRVLRMLHDCISKQRILVQFVRMDKSQSKATFPLMPNKLRLDQAPKPTEEEPESRLSPRVRIHNSVRLANELGIDPLNLALLQPK